MPFSGKSAVPCVEAPLPQSAWQRAQAGMVILLTAPAGYLLTDSLASTLAENKCPTLWVRLEDEDRDPAVFLYSLITAAQRLQPGIGETTLAYMRRYPGPTQGWAPLFEQLGQELADSLPNHMALVLEHLDQLDPARPTLAYLSTHLLPALPAESRIILTTHQNLPRAAVPSRVEHLNVNHLRLDFQTARDWSERQAAGLSVPCLRRLVELTEGRAVALTRLYTASAVLGSSLIQRIVDQARHGTDVLTRVISAWVATTDKPTRQALALAAHLEYSHPNLVQAALDQPIPLACPWLQPLAGGWVRVPTLWRGPVNQALRELGALNQTILRRAAAYWLSVGAVGRAIRLYLELGDYPAAAQAMARAANECMGLGQWHTLTTWMSLLPASVRREWPWLVYTNGEIAAAQGDIRVARQEFTLATSQFERQRDADGLCQSLLAESALTAWAGDMTQAQARAHAALAQAEAARLTWYQGWANWHLACLAAEVDQLDNALAYLAASTSAAIVAGDTVMIELLRLTSTLIEQQRELRRQREYHRQAYFELERAEYEVKARLRALLRVPPQEREALLRQHGWSHTPLTLKVSAPVASNDAPTAPESVGLWGTLLGALGLRRRPAKPALPLPTLPEERLAPSSISAITLDPPSLSLPAPSQAELALPTLTVHLLGACRVAFNDTSVETWPSQRGRAVFKYLVTHRAQPIPREALMAQFWPDADAKAGRNNLNVAIYGLRRALRAVTDMPIVLFEGDAYHLANDLQVWLDVEQFEQSVERGRGLETAGHLAEAIGQYELAAGLYQGDFLADDPYEEWPVRTREWLRDAYLDTLDRLSHIYFGQGQYAECVRLCQLILTRDNAREDVHCRLMRCYSRQGQHRLALQQYQTCIKALRDELDVAPAPATQRLYERIRHRETDA